MEKEFTNKFSLKQDRQKHDELTKKKYLRLKKINKLINKTTNTKLSIWYKKIKKQKQISRDRQTKYDENMQKSVLLSEEQPEELDEKEPKKFLETNEYGEDFCDWLEARYECCMEDFDDFNGWGSYYYG